MSHLPILLWLPKGKSEAITDLSHKMCHEKGAVNGKNNTAEEWLARMETGVSIKVECYVWFISWQWNYNLNSQDGLNIIHIHKVVF